MSVMSVTKNKNEMYQFRLDNETTKLVSPVIP